MNRTLAVTKLAPGKRQQLESTKQWVERIRAEIVSKAKELSHAESLLKAAQQRRNQYDCEAATSEDAAMKVGAAELQIRKLQPECSQLQQALNGDLLILARQIANIRKDDIFPAIQENLYEQLYAPLAEALRPFFAPKALRSVGESVLKETPAFWQTADFLAPIRESHQLTTADEALSALGDLLRDLNAILKGEPLLELSAPEAPATASPARPHRPTWSEEQLADMKREGNEILSKAQLQIANAARA